MTHTTVSFQNDGLIDLRAVKTFGVSVKESDNPIGFFGTGLKYAVAILLRSGHEVDVWRGMDQYSFGVTSVSVRGDDFDIVTLDGEELGMTTQVGKTWEMWMALRELYCNTMDEGGVAEEGELAPEDGKTTIHVRGVPFSREFAARDEIFLSGEPIAKFGKIEIHHGHSPFLFYRGVRVYGLSEPSRYTYNIIGAMDLTEDRTLKYWFEAHHHLVRGFAACTRKDILSDVLTSRGFEKSLDYSATTVSPSAEFIDVVGALRREMNRDLNSTAKRLHVNVTGDDDRFKEVDLLPAEQDQVSRAVEFLLSAGVTVTDYPIRVAESLGTGILGLANRKTNEIWISRRCLMMGGRMLIGTILEEYLHLAHGVDDETREMQNFLVDLAVTFAERWVHSASSMQNAA